jgi:hypothetical protein
MPNQSLNLGRRALITGAAVTTAAAIARAQTQSAPAPPETKLQNIPLTASNTITAERRDDIVLIGPNRPFIQNRLDPPSRARLSEVFQGR